MREGGNAPVALRPPHWRSRYPAVWLRPSGATSHGIHGAVTSPPGSCCSATTPISVAGKGHVSASTSPDQTSTRRCAAKAAGAGHGVGRTEAREALASAEVRPQPARPLRQRAGPRSS